MFMGKINSWPENFFHNWVVNYIFKKTPGEQKLNNLKMELCFETTKFAKKNFFF